MNFELRMLRNLDYGLIIVTLALSGIGMAVIASAAMGYDPAHASTFVYKQVAGLAIGLVLMAVVLLFDYGEFSRMYRTLYFTNLALLGLVLLVGFEQYGAKSWLRFGPVQMQPVELTKVFLVLTLSHLLSQQEQMTSLWDMVPPFIHVLPSVLLIMKQPDLGSMLVVLAMLVGAMYIAGAPGWRFLLFGGATIGGVAAWVWAHLQWKIWLPLSGYQLGRLLVWIDPEPYAQDWGYNVIQSRIAIGSGGLWGKGLFQGTQNQLGFLPEQHTDFIFSVLGEEWGFVGGALVLVLFLFVLWRVLAAALQAKDRYGMLICGSVFSMLLFHLVENVGMTMGVMPVTGIPLPFISYGPTAMVANFVAIGLVLNVQLRRQKIMF